jgi:hypothetical protein
MGRKRLTADNYHNIPNGDWGEWVGETLPKNCDTKTEWLCYECGVIFTMRYTDIKQGSWHRVCRYKHANDYRRLTIAEYRQMPEDDFLGEWCADTLPEYSNEKTDWLCNECGEIFPMRYKDVKQGRWCPTCSSYRSEKLCRQYFEELTGKPFPKTKPCWLLNDTKKETKLELDGYNEELHVAFEYQGIQHYKFKRQWHKTLEIFEAQQHRDFIKRELCDVYEIKLCTIPYTLSCHKPEQLKQFIQDWLNAKKND